MDNANLTPASAAGLMAGAALSGANGEVSPMATWLQHRHRLVEALTYELRAGFQAVAAFHGPEYLDAVERQQGLAQRILSHDRSMPLPEADADAMRSAASALRHMNRELKRLNDIQAALIENGGRSVRCFQRVWAMAGGEPAGYSDPAAGARGGH